MSPRILFLFLFTLASGLHAAEPPTKDLLRQGLFEEEANHDFDKAAESYRAVIAAHDRQRALAATATFRLGEIARKNNDKEAAATAFRTVTERFPEQTDLARMSQENLAALGMAAPAPVPPAADPFAPGPSKDPEDVEIERLKDLARSSPDLIDGASESGWRPLHLAAADGKVKVMAYLLENKVDVNSRTTQEQLTPLQIASVTGHLTAVNALLSAKAKIDDITVLKDGFDKSLPPHDTRVQKISGEWTALDLAVLYDRREVARALIKAGADIKRTGPYISGNLTSLMESLYLGRDEITKAIIEAGAPLGATAEQDSNSPLMTAIRYSPSLVAVLLKAGADPNLGCGADHWTPLQVVVERGQLDLAKLLVDSGADVRATNDPKRTALHFATTPEMVDFLISKDADPNAKNIDGLTPLDAMAMKSNSTANVAAFEDLLAKGAVVVDAAALLQRTSPDMQQTVRARVVYPLVQRPDNILLSVLCYAKDGPQWVKPLDIRPALGSPPPSVLEGLTVAPNSSPYSSLGNLKVVRRDEQGRFTTVFDWTPRPDEGTKIEFPALQWGDILEYSLTNRSGAPPLRNFEESLADRTVTVRFGGISTSRIFFRSMGSLLGDLGAYFPKQPGTRPRVIPKNVDVAPDANLRLPDLPLIPDFVDSTKILVTRKGVEKPILIDLGAKDAPPFRLIEGDVMDLALKESVREDMRTNNKLLFLISDFTFGGTIKNKGLLSSVGLLKFSSKPVDLSDIQVFREGDVTKMEHFDFFKILPDDELLRTGGNEVRDPLLKLDSLQAGDWVLALPLPQEADEAAVTAASGLLSKMWNVENLVHPPQPGIQPTPGVTSPSKQRPRVVPPSRQSN